MNVTRIHTVGISFDYEERENLELYSRLIFLNLQARKLQTCVNWNRNGKYHFIESIQISAKDEDVRSVNEFLHDAWCYLHNQTTEVGVYTTNKNTLEGYTLPEQELPPF